MKKNLKKIVLFSLMALSFWIMLDYGLPQADQKQISPTEQMLQQAEQDLAK